MKKSLLIFLSFILLSGCAAESPIETDNISADASSEASAQATEGATEETTASGVTDKKKYSNIIKYDYSNYKHKRYEFNSTEEQLKAEVKRLEDKYFKFPMFYSNDEILKEAKANSSYDVSQNNKNIYEIIEMLLKNNYLLYLLYFDTGYTPEMYNEVFQPYQKLDDFVDGTFVEEIADELLKGYPSPVDESYIVSPVYINKDGKTKFNNANSLRSFTNGVADKWGFTIDDINNGICFFTIYVESPIGFDYMREDEELKSLDFSKNSYFSTRCAAVQTDKGWRLSGDLLGFDEDYSLIFKKGILTIPKFRFIEPEDYFPNLYKEVN